MKIKIYLCFNVKGCGQCDIGTAGVPVSATPTLRHHSGPPREVRHGRAPHPVPGSQRNQGTVGVNDSLLTL